MGAEILTNDAELDNNSRDKSHKLGYEKHVQVANIGQEKILYNEIFLNVIYEYIKNGFMWWRDSTSNVYVDIGIWNLCCDYILCEIDKTSVQLFMMGISLFIHVYV